MDVPDPIQPHPFADAVSKMDQWLYNSWCYSSEGLFSYDAARKEFHDISNSGDITRFFAVRTYIYCAAFILKAREDLRSAKAATWAKCAYGMLGHISLIKQYVAADLSTMVNLK